MKKTLKAVLAALLVVCLLLPLAACGNNATTETKLKIAIPNDTTNEARALLLLQDQGYIVEADTIEELAALLDVPADELQKTIDRYNELCDQGTDADFGKKSAYMHKIEKAPFWGVRKHIRVSSIDSGVNTNANGQALDADGNVIDGLYCVGNVGGVFYGGADYPFHQTGLSLGRCYTFGMLAAKHAMGQL